MDNRVFLAFSFAEVLKDLRHIGMTEQIHEVLDGPANGVRHIHAGDFGKEFAEKRICLGQFEGRHFAGELPVRGGVDAGGKEAIGQRLREHIGELGFREIGNQRFPESRQPVVQPRAARRHGCAVGFPRLLHEFAFRLLGLVFEGCNDQIADDPRHARHALSEFLGGADRQRRFMIKGCKELIEFLVAVRCGLDAALAVKIGHPDGQALLARGIPAELQVIGEDPVRQRRVSFELLSIRPFASLHLVEIDADVLRLDVAYRDSLPGDVEIRRAAGNATGFVRGVNVFVARLQEGFQGGAVRVFRGIAFLKALPDLPDVFRKRVHLLGIPPGPGSKASNPP